ncbi:MAG: tRNA (N6-isopentenyl adenosine(37)-C2)-methylthiotransferase MiaB [Defluviitaleaceae bacterium]|nr:tRNA (N6-isopentenyl adenosine(37)-C2)-methylthiotransferase MiaB [Defluviitaleaceae bacterium]
MSETIQTIKGMYHINTYGCQANVHDSEKIAGILRCMGYLEAADEEEATLILFNTCCVRENAENKLLGHLGQVKRMKEKRPELLVAVCGCMMQQDAAVTRLRQSYPYVDVIFGTFNLHALPELLDAARQGGRQVVDVWESHGDIREDLPVQREHSFKASVNIMYGCNNYCSFCIVPYVRGRERSRGSADILNECRELAAGGAKEVLLLGQNVNSYGSETGGAQSFAKLLREIQGIDGLERIRFMTSHPKDLSDELVRAIADCGKVCRHVHLPVQSGSDRILAAMNRRYTKAGYLELVRKLKAISPDMRITTDIIVGFPGETEQDFEHTLDVVRQARFQNAFTFKYSKRTGTPAASMADQVDGETVDRRFARLLEELTPIAYEISASNIGRTVKVLAEEVNSADPGRVTGRAEDNSIVHFDADASCIGRIVDVRVTGCRTFYLSGLVVRYPNPCGDRISNCSPMQPGLVVRYPGEVV